VYSTAGSRLSLLCFPEIRPPLILLSPARSNRLEEASDAVEDDSFFVTRTLHTGLQVLSEYSFLICQIAWASLAMLF